MGFFSLRWDGIAVIRKQAIAVSFCIAERTRKTQEIKMLANPVTPNNAKNTTLPPYYYPEIQPHSRYSTMTPPINMPASRSICTFPPVCAMSRTRPAEFLSDVWKEAKTWFCVGGGGCVSSGS